MDETSAKRTLINIWPKIYRITNGFFYFLLNTFRSLVKNSLNQIRNG
jgi:hypothetical protein